MKERDPIYVVIQGGKIISMERYLTAAVDRAWCEAESRPGEPAEVRRRGADLSIYWRVVSTVRGRPGTSGHSVTRSGRPARLLHEKFWWVTS